MKVQARFMNNESIMTSKLTFDFIRINKDKIIGVNGGEHTELASLSLDQASWWHNYQRYDEVDIIPAT